MAVGLILFCTCGDGPTRSYKPFQGKIGERLEQTQQAWPERVKEPKEAPNVVWILLDDVGFGATSAFLRISSTTHSVLALARWLLQNFQRLN